jgi:hypothetical protein
MISGGVGRLRGHARAALGFGLIALLFLGSPGIVLPVRAAAPLVALAHTSVRQTRLAAAHAETSLPATTSYSNRSTPTWRNLATSGPAGRDRAGMAFDAADNYVVLQGGYNGSGGWAAYADTWILADGKWSDITPTLTASPGARASAAMAYDPALQKVFLFGGLVAFGTPANDTWLFAAGQWTPVTGLSASPSPRYAPAFIYDPVARAMILFGGTNNTVDFNDTWEFTSAMQWVRISAGTSPAARDSAGFAWSAADQAGVLFGGFNASQGNSRYGDTWLYRNGLWSSVGSTTSPGAQGLTALTSDPATGGVLLYGGTDAQGNSLAGTWEFEHGEWTNWTALVTGSPGPRGSCAIVGLSLGGTPEAILLFGGFQPAPTWLSDTWVFDRLTVNVSVGPVIGEAPTAVNASASASNGLPGAAGYTFNWSVNGLPIGTGSSISDRRSSAGSYVYRVVGADAVGLRVSVSFQLTAVAAVGLSIASRPASSVDVGQPVRIDLSITGGAAPFAYEWTTPTAFCSGAAGNSTTCRPSSAGVYNVTASVTDGNARSAAAALRNFTVFADPRITSFAANTTTPGIGASVAFTLALTGGTGTGTFVGTGFPSGCRPSAPRFVCSFPTSGTFDLRVGFEDSNGAFANSTTLTINVQSRVAPLSGPAWFGSGTLDLLIAVAVAVVAAALLLARSRRRPPSPPGEPESGQDAPPAVSEPSESGPPPADSLSTESARSASEFVPGPDTTSERILLHLARQPRLTVEDIAPPSLTQAGIGEGLGKPQNSIARALLRLESSGAVFAEVRHVQGARRRQKVYQLTPRGVELARASRLRRGPNGSRPGYRDTGGDSVTAES